MWRLIQGHGFPPPGHVRPHQRPSRASRATPPLRNRAGVVTSPGLAENRKKKTDDNSIGGRVVLPRQAATEAALAVVSSAPRTAGDFPGVGAKMSALVKLFGGGGKGGKQPTPQEAIQRLRETEEMLTKKQDHLEKKIEEELLTAKRNGTKNKRGKGPTEHHSAEELADVRAHARTHARATASRLDQCSCSPLCPAALQALKRKKRYEEQLTRIDGTLSTIEFQREALENANTNTEVLKNMGFAAKAMKKTHENMYGGEGGGETGPIGPLVLTWRPE